MKTKFLLNWLTEIQEFSVDVQHISGKDNILVDCLSRMSPAYKYIFKDDKTKDRSDISDLISE